MSQLQNTYIPFSSRVAVILHMSFAFWVVAWFSLSPFLGEHLELKSRLLLYQNVMGINIANTPEEESILENNKNRFASQAPLLKAQVMREYQRLTTSTGKSIWIKLNDSLKLTLFAIPPFLQAWIFFSILLGILVLKRIEGAQLACYLLLLISASYSYINLTSGKNPQISSDLKLVPSEAYIIQNYLDKPLNEDPFIQQVELREGWENYLVKEWAKSDSSRNSPSFPSEIERGLYNFTLARILILEGKPLYQISYIEERKGVILHLIFLAWNLFFAWFINRKDALALQS